MRDAAVGSGDFADLRRAAHDLERERVIAALAGAFAAWRRLDGPWRRRLAEDLDVYSPAGLDCALGAGLADWDEAALQRLCERELARFQRTPELTAVWLAETVPPAVFSALALPLLAGSAVYAKPARGDRASAALFVESLAGSDPGVARAICLGADEAALDEADAVVAYGSDATVNAVRARVPFPKPFLGYGHKLSAAAVGPRADLAAAAARVASDAALYDGRGCLSPAYVFVDSARAHELAGALAAQLEALRVRMPRGRLTPEEHARLHELRAAVAVREQSEVWLSAGGTDWGVWRASAVAEAGTLRHVPVLAVDGLPELEAACAQLSPHLSSLAVEGWPDSEVALARAALAGGASRICGLGRLQLPPLDWHHDGVPAVSPLLRTLEFDGEVKP